MSETTLEPYICPKCGETVRISPDNHAYVCAEYRERRDSEITGHVFAGTPMKCLMCELDHEEFDRARWSGQSLVCPEFSEGQP